MLSTDEDQAGDTSQCTDFLLCSHVACNADIHFATLREAIDSSESGSTIQLLKDVNENVTIPSGKEVTFVY